MISEELLAEQEKQLLQKRRRLIATAIMSGIAAGSPTNNIVGNELGGVYSECAEAAVAMADCLIEELDKKPA